MKLIIIVLFLIPTFLCISCNKVYAVESFEFKAPINQLIKKSKIKSKDLSLIVQKNNDQKIEFELNPTELRIPASLTKIITASAVLSLFPKGTKFKTKLLSKAKIKNTKLMGSLYLQGDGDPAFVSESMWVLVNHFMRTGITEINGDIIVDDSKFDSERYDSSRDPGRVDRAYDAPVGAMSFNWNSINIYVRSDRAKGKSSNVFLDPKNEYTILENKTHKGGSGSSLNARRTSKNHHNIFRITGGIGKSRKEKVIYKSITEPDYWSGYNLKAFLERRGIIVTGTVKTGVYRGPEKILAEVESKDIDLIVKDMMKFSNNYVAEMLTKNLGAISDNGNGKRKGIKKINQYLASIGLNEKNVEFYNPSGLTRKNKITVTALNSILNSMQKEFGLFSEFLVSLPISGVDGTLKRRMKESKGLIRAKTGRLNGVTGLAGFVSDTSGETYSFAFLFNGSHSKLNDANALFDMVLKLVYKK